MQEQNPIKSTGPVPGEYPFIPVPEGSEDIPPGPVTKGTLPGALIQDDISTSVALLPIAKSPEPKTPEIPVPDHHEMDNAILKGQIIQKIRKNPWFTSRNMMGAFLKIMFDIIQVQQTLHFNEASSEVTIRRMIFNLSMENAELAQLLKNKEAEEQLIQAVNSFVNAGVSTIQLGSNLKARADAREKVDGEKGEYGKSLQVQKQELKDFVTEKNQDLQAGQVPAGTQPQAALPAPDPDRQRRINENRLPDNASPADKEKLAKMKADLDERERRRPELISRQQQSDETMSQINAEIAKQGTQGACSVATALVKQEQGKLEKEKQQLDALNRMYQSYNDATNRAKQEAGDSIGKAIDSMDRAMRAYGQRQQHRG